MRTDDKPPYCFIIRYRPGKGTSTEDLDAEDTEGVYIDAGGEAINGTTHELGRLPPQSPI